MQTSILSFRRGPALLAAAAPRRVPLVACRRLLSSDVVATSTPAGAKGDLSTETAAPIADKSTISSFTGAPTGMMETRVVKIFQQAQGVQNATQNMLSWRMQWEDEQTQRWTNPLMGWTSTNDPLSNANMTLDFATAEDAARFCEQNGARPPSDPCPRHTRPTPTSCAMSCPPQVGSMRSSSQSLTRSSTRAPRSMQTTSRGRAPRGAPSPTCTSHHLRLRPSRERVRVGGAQYAAPCSGGLNPLCCRHHQSAGRTWVAAATIQHRPPCVHPRAALAPRCGSNTRPACRAVSFLGPCRSIVSLGGMAHAPSAVALADLPPLASCAHGVLRVGILILLCVPACLWQRG